MRSLSRRSPGQAGFVVARAVVAWKGRLSRRSPEAASFVAVRAVGTWKSRLSAPVRVAPPQHSRVTPPEKHEPPVSSGTAPSRPPQFHALPPILRYPTLEKYMVFTFSPALVASATALIGAQAGGLHKLELWSLSLASLLCVLVGLFFARELQILRHFRRRHHDQCWHGAERPLGNEEVDDPLLALAGRLRVMRPRLRGRGGFEPPDGDCHEPQRTEGALRRALKPCARRKLGSVHERAGEMLETMPMWLDDANHTKGVFYTFVQLMLQLAVAVLTGVLYAHPFSVTQPGSMFVVIALIVIQSALCVWVWCNTANDLFTATEDTSSYLCELLSTCLVFAANILAYRAGDEVERLEVALTLATVGANLLVYSCFLPIFFTLYDTFIVPVIHFIWRSEVSWSETMCQLLTTTLLLPFEVASAFLGHQQGDITGNLNDFAGSVEGTAVASAASLEGQATSGQLPVDKSLGLPPALPKAPSNRAAMKRVKHEQFLSRVRSQRKLQR